MTLIEALRAAIETWVSRSKHNNLNVLAEKCGMSYSTLYRLASGQIEKPQIDSVLAVLRVALSKAERYSFLTEYYPALAEDFSKEDHFLERSHVQTDLSRPDVNKLFEHRDGFLLGQHLLSDSGISSEKVQELYGQHGINLLKTLEHEGTAHYMGGVWKIPIFFVAADLESNLRQVRHSVDSFQAASAEVKAAYIRTLSNSVTLTAARRIRSLIDECAIEVDRIAEENPGGHVFLANFVTQLLDPQAAIEEQVKVRGEVK